MDRDTPSDPTVCSRYCSSIRRIIVWDCFVGRFLIFLGPWKTTVVCDHDARAILRWESVLTWDENQQKKKEGLGVSLQPCP